MAGTFVLMVIGGCIGLILFGGPGFWIGTTLAVLVFGPGESEA